jgi:imidazolonepropionase-like amidohydrolase
MSRAFTALAVLCAILGATVAQAESVLIHNATVHTMTGGALEGADVLITDGKVVSIGKAVRVAGGATVIDATGKIVTPGLFGGLTYLGLDEIGLEPTLDDQEVKLGEMRPEFDVTPAFDADATSIGVNRLGGVTFAAVTPTSAGKEGSVISGQGPIVTLDGTVLEKSRALYIDLGADISELTGGSRAVQYMLLRQAFMEARTPNLVLNNDQRLLTPAGRQTLLAYATGAAPLVFDVDRASDIRQVLALAAREKLHVVISGGAEAWRVAPELAAAKVPVILDPLVDLPANFDGVGSTLENAARLDKAGVELAFSFGDPESHNIRKIRQAAGIAVAHGLPWDKALAAITRNPAEIFGVADRVGSIETGRLANLVVWSGDPLEVTSVAEQVFIGGKLQPQTSRQTELRDRYLERLRQNAAR